MRFRLEEFLEIAAVLVIVLNVLSFTAGNSVYDRINKTDEVKTKILLFRPDFR